MDFVSLIYRLTSTSSRTGVLLPVAHKAEENQHQPQRHEMESARKSTAPVL